MLAYYVQSDEGVTGAKTAVASISDHWVAQQIAIRPGQGRSGSSSGRTGTASTGENTTHEIAVFEQGSTEIQAYPNPVNKYVAVSVDGMTQEPNDDDISVVDQVGRSYPVKSEWNGQNNELKIDFEDIGAGIYFIRVNTTTGSRFVRVIKVSE
jgi:hypothetical protein